MSRSKHACSLDDGFDTWIWKVIGKGGELFVDFILRSFGRYRKEDAIPNHLLPLNF